MVEGIGESSSQSTHIDVESLTHYDVYMLQSKRRMTIDTAKLELDHYLAEEPLPKTPGFDVLNWWKSNEGESSSGYTTIYDDSELGDSCVTHEM